MSKIKIVAEIGINHNGDILNALKLIEVAKQAGADFVKFQKRTLNVLYSEEVMNKPKESPWGTTYGEYKTKLEFGQKEFDAIDCYCMINDIPWFASPWDPDAVKFLTQYKNPYIKVASASMTDFETLEEIKKTKIPVIISTGMCTKEEVDKVVNFLGKQIEYVLACTSTYPTPPEEVNLSFIKTLKSDYPQYKIGYSNHSPGTTFMTAAAAFDINMIEFHVTLDRAMYGSDQASSIEIPGIIKTIKAVRNIEKSIGTGEWTVFPGEEPIKKKLRRVQ